MLLKDGYHAPMCFIFTEQGIAPCICNYKTDEEKARWFESLREKLGELNASGVVFITEGWLKDCKEGKIDLPVRKYQDKREILVISLASRYGNKMATIEFERGENEIIILGEQEIKTEYCDNLIAPYFEQVATVH